MLSKLHRFFPDLKKTNSDYTIIIEKGKFSKDISIDDSKKTICFDLDKLTYKPESILKKIFKEEFNNNNCIFIQNKKNDLLNNLYKYHKECVSDKELLNNYKNVIAKQDIDILSSSLYIKYKFSKKENITYLKQDLINKYGQRGNIISNLCTAGYFHEIMIQLIKTDLSLFHEYYDFAVNRCLIALFVNKSMKVSDLSSEIKLRLEKAKFYGLEYIHIHAIGKSNIEKISKSLKKLQKEEIITDKDNVFENNDLEVCVVEIRTK